jgi:hypothetical protein
VKLTLLTVSLLLPVSLFPQSLPYRAPSCTKGFAKLSDVVSEVNVGLVQLDSDRETKSELKSLPALEEADFTFQTTTTTTGTFNFSIFVLSLNAKVAKQDINQVIYSFVKPPTPRITGQQTLQLHTFSWFGKHPKPPRPELRVQLVDAIEKAASEQAASIPPPGTKPGPLVINMSFGIDCGGGGGVTVPIHLVTLGGGLNYDKNNVQSVKLTFGKKPTP